MRFSLFSPAAQQDYNEILDYILAESHNVDATLRYADAIEHMVSLIEDNPHIGRHRDDVDPQYRSIPVQSHLIFYRVSDGQVQIARILHASRDIAKALHRR